MGGGALGALLGGFAYLHLGKWLGFFALLLLLLGCLALNGYLGRWVRFVRVRLEDGRIARQEEERRRREEDADRNFELDRRTMLRAEEMIPQTPRRARPHAPETPVEARRRAADEPASPMDAPRRRTGAAAEAPAEAAPRRRARTDEPASPMEARSRRRAAGADAAAEEAPAPRPKKRVKTAPRIYNETVEDGSAPAGEDAFGPVVRVGGAVPAAHGKKAEKAVKAETQEAEKDVWAHPAKEEVTEQTTFAEDLTIEPDEYELPDDEAPFDVPPAGKKPLPRFKKGAPAPEAEDEEAYAYPPIDLLAHGQAPDRHESDQSDMEKAQLLGDTLRSFGIETRLTGIGPRPGGDAL